MLIRRAEILRGEVELPGDKSISHRAALIAALAEGETRIENFATSADCASTLDCLSRLGVRIRREGTTVLVDGVGRSGLRPPGRSLDCGNSGTTMRLLAGVLAGQSFECVLDGDESLRSRPMGRVIDPLIAMGARIDSNGGRAPLIIHGRERLSPIAHRPSVSSAQVKSCVLLAGLSSGGCTSVIEPVRTRDHTERMLRWFGVDVEEIPDAGGRKISLNGDTTLVANDITVPGDISSAVFFIVAAASLPGSEILLRNVGLNPTRTAVIELLRDGLGADIRLTNRRELNNEPLGDIFVTGVRRAQMTDRIRGEIIPNLIDELPALAVFGTQLKLGLEVREASELRVKESDRIASVVANLKRMGAEIDEFDDGFHVALSRLRGAAIDSYGDHRIAMAFAVAGLIADGETEIERADCVNVSFPGFFEVLEDVVFR